MKVASLLLGLTLPLIALRGMEPLKLECIPSPNLVKNADFRKIDESGRPAGWRFDNCSKSPHFKSHVIEHPEGNYLAVNTAWNQFGYWLQDIPVKEGVPYLVSCEIESDGPELAIWLMCNPTRSSKKKSPGSVRYLVPMAVRHGEERRAMLKDFIDEDLIPTLSEKQWYRLGKDVIFPLDRGIDKCTVRFGIHGGYAGQARYRNPVFREAKAELKVEISGTGWQELYVRGAQPEKTRLDPDSEKQQLTLILPRARCVYEVVLSGKDGKKVTREISNE